MEGLVNKIFNLKKRDYIYKKKCTGVLSTHFSQLTDPIEGSSTSTYRRIQCDKSHLPIKFWEGMTE